MTDYLSLYKGVERFFGYNFRTNGLLTQAFTRSSYAKEYGCESNESLEYIGDSCLSFIVTKTISDFFGYMKTDGKNANSFSLSVSKGESFFTETKKKLVSNQNLAKIVRENGFLNLLRLGKCDVDNNAIAEIKVQADLFESIIGAIAIDCCWDQKILANVISKTLSLNLCFNNIIPSVSVPKGIKMTESIQYLKEEFEHERCSLPVYEISDKPLIDNGNQWWMSTCHVKSWGLTKTGYATSKKEAKAYSAYLVICERFGLEDEEEKKRKGSC